MSNLQKRLHMNKLPPMPPPGVGGGRGGKKGMMRGKRDYSPVTWDNYFDTMQDLHINEHDTFRVYQRGESGPVCCYLHGGGFSALSWAVLCKSVSECVTCRGMSFDLRGHGDTYTDDDEKLDAETMAQDVGKVIQALYGDEESAPPIILVGHSMGGAIAVHTAFRELIPSLIGVMVIDVVEGTALEALTSMQSFLRGRPSSFNSLEHAIEWCVRTGQVRNMESAKVSMVGQVKKLTTNETATSVIEHRAASPMNNAVTDGNSIWEEDEEEAGVVKGGANCSGSPQLSPQPVKPEHRDEFKEPMSTALSEKFTWRINLSKTEKFWRGWFEGLSNMFLSCAVPKMLLLAGVDRLDKDLTVGQMQGKFQLEVLPQCGHAVHEDSPDKVAEVLANFMVRHKVAEPTSNFHRSMPMC